MTVAPHAATSDAAATEVAALRARFAAQRAAFARGAPGYQQRMLALATLRDAVRARQDDLVRAVSEDFGGRAAEETLMLELFPFYEQVRHARRHLRKWMRRTPVRSSWFLLPSSAFYQYQPLGVAGIIGAWNYQLLLTLGPLVDAVAAGNHVLLKPSEITPRSAAVIAEIIAGAFPAEYIGCVTGGAELASEFSRLPFDHLFFTGSTRVGTLVMQAAAERLTPVTLELGGKSPAVVHASYDMALAAARIMAGKLLNAGQTCVAPDYVLVPEGGEAAFEAEARKAAGTLYPRLRDNPDYTRIVSEGHFARLHSLRDEAVARGARAVTLAAGDDLGGDFGDDLGADRGRLFPPTLLFGTTDSMKVMQEEIFGPILPVVTYASLDDAIAYVNARPRPLALYYFDDDAARADDLLQRTMSGGAAINDCLYHLGQHNLPFGGVGPSGMGHYHGFDGFATFSKKRGVMVQRRWAPTALFNPPYDARAKRLVKLLLGVAQRGR